MRVFDIVPIIESPRDFRSGKIGIEKKPRVVLKEGFGSLVFQLLAKRSAPTVLPNDRSSKRLGCLLIPKTNRLALIGDPDRDDLARVDVLGDFVNRLDDRAPDVVQVMFDPT